MAACQDMIRHTASAHAPWYVLAADNKWVTRVVAVAAIIEGLSSRDLAYPRVDDAKREELAVARGALTRQGGAARASRRGA